VIGSMFEQIMTGMGLRGGRERHEPGDGQPTPDPSSAFAFGSGATAPK
jgi:hypothetical protein